MTDQITVTITQARGSTPRGAGTAMRVTKADQSGTIGGGRLEWEALRIARDMLADGRTDHSRTFPLGPDLGQCCGGAVTLDFSRAALPDPEPETPVWIWGAGHVGRALAQILGPTDHVTITWIDTSADRFPAAMPPHTAPLIAADPARAMPHAPAGAHHLILTYSHDMDLALCDAALNHGFATAGLIGSATKWARFRTRLSALGHAEPAIDRIICPIGDPSLGKHPQAIAVGVAARLLSSVSQHTERT